LIDYNDDSHRAVFEIYSSVLNGINKGKSKEIVLFINSRYVQCESIKKAIDRAYNSCHSSIHD